ncbi:MAG: hypothetical protein CVU74_01150 [Deltaproteobacteria bacterium HGW-Deltaproteobacteria-9]|jgi:uncharacterized phage protein gp47/JayE|nr:MAG: hypothetical protein CVU74_01150 [Deltaproteobacteria bacterium HGW-Deltaproteobacteria-9]
MDFQKDFDTLFAAILTDWQNQFPEADLSQGSLIYMKSACLASALWGLYKYQDWIAKQMFPDTAETAYLEHHGWVRGISRNVGETDADYLARILEYIRRPPAGGNQYDYIKWAKEIDGVAQAWCVPLGQGLGTVDVIILADVDTTGSEIPSSSARIGVTTSVTVGKLKDSAGTFTTAHAVAAGDIVENPLRGTQTTVSTVDSAIQLTLVADIFKYAGEPYIIHSHTGVNTSISAGKLVDSAGAFTDSTYTVKPGDIVENITDNTETTIDTVDAAGQATLTDDIFLATGKSYVIKGLVAQVKSYIDPLRPVTASKVTIFAPTPVTQAVTMTATGTGIDLAAIADNIEAYMNTMIPGQTLYKAKLVQIAMDAGAANATVSTPASDVSATTYQMIRPGAISVS